MPNLILIFIIILIVFFSMIKIKNPSLIPVKYKKYLVISYCAILIVSTLILYFIPKSNFLSNKPNSNIITTPSLENFKDLASKGKLNASDSFTKNGNWSFDYTGKKLIISDSSMTFTLVGERKTVDDGKIEVMNYVTDSSFNDINITDKIKPASAKLNKNTLRLYDEPNSPIKINQFSFDFTISQFIKDSPNQNNTNISSSLGMRIVYIRIPKNLQIDADSKTFQLIN